MKWLGNLDPTDHSKKERSRAKTPLNKTPLNMELYSVQLNKVDADRTSGRKTLKAAIMCAQSGKVPLRPPFACEGSGPFVRHTYQAQLAQRVNLNIE